VIKAVRQRKIREMLEAGGVVTVAGLAEHFNTSPITIRRDLTFLEQKGLLNRTHGGAIVEAEIEASRFAVTPYSDREQLHSLEKTLVAQKAAEFVKDGDSIIINAGTTMSRLARALRIRKNLRVVTNGVTVASEFDADRTTQVYLIGGIVDFSKMATTGPAAEQAMHDIRVPRAFLGISGISVSDGISMYNPEEARINRTLLECAKEVIIVTDSSKFDSQAIYRVAPLDNVHRIITDTGISDENRTKIQRLGIELVVVANK
jgi:DeoR/GlpR family transcriptional regulator of sugar metabolism